MLTGSAVGHTHGTDESVTVSVSRRVKAGKEAEYEQWIRGITEAGVHFKGHQGVNILRPSSATQGEYVIIYRFDNYENARNWEVSAERQQWISKLSPLVEGETTRKQVSGLEFWFDLPSVPVTAHAPRHKMALVLMVVVYCLVLLLSVVFAPLIGDWPLWMKLLVVIPIQVLLMTYLVMPGVTRLLKNWLYQSGKQTSGEHEGQRSDGGE